MENLFGAYNARVNVSFFFFRKKVYYTWWFAIQSKQSGGLQLARQLSRHTLFYIYNYYYSCQQKHKKLYNQVLCIIHGNLVSRVNNLVGYNLPDSYLGIPLSIFTINVTLGNKNIKNYTIKCYVYIRVDHTQLKFVQTYLAYCYWCLSVALLLWYFWDGSSKHKDQVCFD